jgi:hypothetical protein
VTWCEGVKQSGALLPHWLDAQGGVSSGISKCISNTKQQVQEQQGSPSRAVGMRDVSL